MAAPDASAPLLGLEIFGVKPGLSRIRRLLAALGNPQKKLATVHVAGTNGKGSVCALVQGVLEAAGYRAGLYTSPHLVSERERIRVGDRFVSRRFLNETVRALKKKAARAGDPFTYFEALTAAALAWFVRQRVDVAVVEAGMGGRLDATNVFASPVCVITPVDLDHERVLGRGVRRIAREKAGIVHRGASLVTFQHHPGALAVLARVCREKKAQLRVVPGASPSKPAPGRRGKLLQTPTLRTPGGREYRNLPLPLWGGHQRQNALLALAALEAAQEAYGLVIPERAVQRGFARVLWPGRFQVFRSRGERIVADGAHNPDGMRALACALAQMMGPGRRIPVVAGFSGDKDAAAMVSLLLPVCSRLTFCGTNNPRTRNPEALARRFAGRLPVPVDWIARIGDRPAAPGTTWCLTGSLFLVGEWMERIARGALTGRFEHAHAGMRAFLRQGAEDLSPRLAGLGKSGRSLPHPAQFLVQ